MTLKELYEALTVNGINRERPYVKIKDDFVQCDSKVIEQYGSRIVHDVNVVWEQKKIYVWLKATNQEIAEAYLDGFFK